MLCQQQHAELVESRPDRRYLLEDLVAVPAPIHHPLDSGNLPGYPTDAPGGVVPKFCFHTESIRTGRALSRKMRGMKWLLLIALLSTCVAASAQETSKKETKAQKDARMKWWREARFGMFIHWGLYAIPAGKWKDRTNHAEWIRETAHIPVAEYEPFIEQFNPVKFDAVDWVRMAEEAGMKYLVITSKHHDGFNLFDSPNSDWDVMSTPFKRDILKELSEACKPTSVRFCTYHSIMDWHHPDYLPKRSWEGESWREAKYQNGPFQSHTPAFDRFVKFLGDEVRTIIERYRPGVMWFDGEWESTWNHGYGGPLYDICRKADPSIIVNNRVDVGRGGMAGFSDAGFAGDFGTPEQEIPASGIPGVDWESCMTMNNNWGFNAADKNFKSTTRIIRDLVDIVSKGGNYLLNIGPKADGTFPEESIQRLKEIGKWMKVNGEAIYGTQASPFKTLPWGRSTVKPGATSTLYLHVFEWPKDGKLVVPGLGNEPIEAQILGSKVLSSVTRAGADLVVSVPKEAPDEHATVVELKVKGAPIVYETPVIGGDSEMLVDTLNVRIEAGSKDLEVRYTTDGTSPSLKSPLYKGAFRIKGTTTVKALSFHKGRVVSGVASKTFKAVEAWAATVVDVSRPGLQRQSFKGDWNKVPDFARHQPNATINGTEVDLGEFKSTEFIGLEFTGWIDVPSTGVYAFALMSDDGSNLWIDGKLVVENDGLHSPGEKVGFAPLAKGRHNFRVGYFNKTGGAELSVKWGKAGGKLTALAKKSLWH